MHITIKPSKNKIGYTKQEILDIIRPLKIHWKTFNKKFGINTCALDIKTGEILCYKCDVELAIECCLENRDKYKYEWD